MEIEMLDVIVAIVGVLTVVLLWVVLYDSNRFVVKKYTAADRRIRKPCRAVVIADLHNKRFGKNNERLLAAVREQQPDFIFIAGDILTAKPRCSMEPALELLGKLAEEFRIFYGNGNHEHRLKLYPKTYGDMAEKYSEALRKIGIEPLVNSHVLLPEYGLAVYGAEIDRFYYKRFKVRDMKPEYLPGILGQAPEGLYTVLLAHNPDYFPQYAGWGADLTLSGHVHGGIARVPFWGKGVIAPTLRFFPKYDGGIYEEDGAVMVLSRGLGTHTIPIRVFNPGELWVVDMKPQEQPPQPGRFPPE